MVTLNRIGGLRWRTGSTSRMRRTGANKTKSVWGVTERRKNTLMNAKPGDLLIFYIAPKRIGGVFRVVSKPYIDREPIFFPVKSRDEVFEYRVRIEPALLPKESIDFTPLIEKLSFIKNKER